MQNNSGVRLRYGWSRSVLEVLVHGGRTYRITASLDEPGRLNVERHEPRGLSARWVFVEHCDTVDEAIQHAIDRKNAELERENALQTDFQRRQEAYKAARTAISDYMPDKR